MPGPARPAQHPQPRHIGQLEQQLHQAGEKHPPGQGDDGLLHLRGQPKGGSDEGEIQEHRGEGGNAEPAVGIEHAAEQGGDGDEQ